MWIELTGYHSGNEYLINADKIVCFEEFVNEGGTFITLLFSKKNFRIWVKETHEEIKAMLLDSKKEKKEKE